MTKSTKFIPVWVGAGPKAIVFNRIDAKEWDMPLFVNVPNGVRETIVEILAKTETGNTRTIAWDMPVAMLEQAISKTDGRPYNKIAISDEFLAEWLNQLVIANKGAVKPANASLLDSFKAKHLASAPAEGTDSF
jgi:hypothetical protein